MNFKILLFFGFGLQRASVTMVKVDCVSQQLRGGQERSHLDRYQRAYLAWWMSFQPCWTLLAFHVTELTGCWTDTAGWRTFWVSRPRHDMVLMTLSTSTVDGYLLLRASVSTRCTSARRSTPTTFSFSNCAVKDFHFTISWCHRAHSRYSVRGWYITLRRIPVSYGHCLQSGWVMMLYWCCLVSWRAHPVTSVSLCWCVRTFIEVWVFAAIRLIVCVLTPTDCSSSSSSSSTSSRYFVF